MIISKPKLHLCLSFPANDSIISGLFATCIYLFWYLSISPTQHVGQLGRCPLPSMWEAMAPLRPAPHSWGPGTAKESEYCLMAKDCSVWPVRCGRPGKSGVRTHFFLSGFQTPPEAEVPSFQGQGVTGKILWFLLDAFAPGDPFEGTMSKDMFILLSIRTWG